MANRTCWHCGITSHLTLNHHMVNMPPGFRRTDATLYQAGFSCDECKHFSVGYAWGSSSLSGSSLSEWLNDSAELTWEPKRSSGKKFPDVPQHIADAASEAHVCQSVGAHRAAGAMARAVVEATAKEKGITSGTLIKKIDAMNAQRIVAPHVAEAAHEIRHFGNDMAHGDFIDPVTAEDADEVLAMMDQILDDVFQSPARIAARKAARQAASGTTP